jgi:2-keto-4-pentenoate hydratase/2-oxohepta-3-ene-1,7-dioic acid hydratase in catechol pathway
MSDTSDMFDIQAGDMVALSTPDGKPVILVSKDGSTALGIAARDIRKGDIITIHRSSDGTLRSDDIKVTH